jgi:hypothetical protein
MNTLHLLDDKDDKIEGGNAPKGEKTRQPPEKEKSRQSLRCKKTGQTTYGTIGIRNDTCHQIRDSGPLGERRT